MARNPALPDGIGMFIRSGEELRQTRLRGKGHCEVKNYVISGDITVDLYIPPVFIGVNPDDHTPEWKRWVQIAGVLHTGVCDVEWLHNGTSVGTQSLSTTAATADLATAIDVAHMDTIQPTITAASGAVDLTLAFVMVVGSL